MPLANPKARRSRPKSRVSGGGAAAAVKTTLADPGAGRRRWLRLPARLQAPLTGEDGEAPALARLPPLPADDLLRLPDRNPGDGLTNDGHPRDVSVELPRGLLGYPAASPVLCTEAELVGSNGCPDASQIGIAGITTAVGEAGNNTVIYTPPSTTWCRRRDRWPRSPPTSPPSASSPTSWPACAPTADYGVEAATRDMHRLRPASRSSASWPRSGATPRRNRTTGSAAIAARRRSCPVDPPGKAFLTCPAIAPACRPGFEMLADTWEGAEPSPGPERTHHQL